MTLYAVADMLHEAKVYIVGHQKKALICAIYLDLPLLFWWFCICLLHWN